VHSRHERRGPEEAQGFRVAAPREVRRRVGREDGVFNQNLGVHATTREPPLQAPQAPRPVRVEAPGRPQQGRVVPRHDVAATAVRGDAVRKGFRGALLRDGHRREATQRALVAVERRRH